MMPEIKRDNEGTDKRPFYVDGYASHRFSTEADAESALMLARQVARNERNELANKIRDALP